MSEQSGEDFVQVPIVWVGIEDVPVYAVNQIVVQHSGANEFVVTFGELTPPIALGTEEQRREQLRMTSFVPIRPVARVGLNRQRLQELITVLQQNLQRHDERFG
jgi:hypothetical protein